MKVSVVVGLEEKNADQWLSFLLAGPSQDVFLLTHVP